jgi:acetoin utilization protein AcuC
MMNDAIFIYSNEFQDYQFHKGHPFNQLRVKLTYQLLKSLGTLDESQVVPPRMAEDHEIALIHDPKYIEAIKKAGRGELSEDVALNYGIGTEDTPIFKNMHEASARIVGGTLSAVESVMEGNKKHALNLAGGLHHGLRGKASGFCIYNDCSIAIKFMQQKYNARVLYVDTDAHHGDGVQWSFYDDSDVCTLSIHETGRYLFPGTGNVNERGQGEGYNYSFNIPVDAFTEDESWIDAYETSLREIASFFKPDIILTQNGADAHYHDPLTHLSSTMKTYQAIPKLAHEIAHEYCDGRWIAVGGGGYDIWRVVPRAWAMVWLEMINKPVSSGNLPENWINKWKHASPVELPTTWEDPENLYPNIPRKNDITEKNKQSVNKVLQNIRQNRSKNRMK